MGPKDAISRYSGLKSNLDNDKIYNGNWFEIDTSRISDAQTNHNFIDLFLGAGGISVGVKSAGFNKIASVEIDNDASNNIRKNFPESVHFDMPIEHLSEEMLDKALNGRKVEVIFGGPPCQGFSVAGLRNANDPRNQLFKEYIRVVKHVMPEYVVLGECPLYFDNGTRQGVSRNYQSICRDGLIFFKITIHFSPSIQMIKLDIEKRFSRLCRRFGHFFYRFS